MLFCLLFDDRACETEVYKMDNIRFILHAHEHVFGFDVRVRVPSLVHCLQPFKELIPEHQGCLQTELSAAEIEKIFEVRTKQINHCVNQLVFGRDAMRIQIRKADCIIV